MTFGTAVDTRGWDTVSVVRVDAVNDAIKSARTTPSGFRQPSFEDTKEIVVSGGFEPWQILNGGDGAQLFMSMPVRDLMIEVNGVPKDYGEASAKVLVELELLPTDVSQIPGTREHLLVVARPSETRTISVINSEMEGKPTLADQARFEDGLEVWLNDHIAKFMHVFAAVTLQDMIEETAGTVWMKPTHSTYAFGRHATDPGASVLGVLSRVGGRSPAGLSIQIDVNDIPAGCNAAFLISRDRLITDMIADGLPLAYEGLKRDQIDVDLDDRVIRLKNGESPMIKTVDHDGSTYEVQLTMLEIEVQATQISVRSQTRTKIIFGAWSVCEAGARYGFGPTTNNAGEDTIGFFLIDEDEPEHTTQLDPGTLDVKKVLFIVAGIIAIIGLVIAGLVWAGIVTIGALTAGAIFGYAMGASGIVGGLGFITWAIEKIQQNDAPAFDLTLSNPVSSVNWCTGTSFKLTEAGLSGAFRIAGIIGGEPVINTMKSAGPPPARAFQDKFAAIMQARAA